MIQAAKLASAKRITAVMPLFPYARQDRKAKPREPISARLVADMLQLAGADRVLTMDLHAGQIQGFFTIPVDHMTALPLFARHFRDLGLTGAGIVSVAPDEGRAKMAVRFAEMIEAEFAIMHKTRPERDQVEVTEITGRVRGQDRDRRRRRDHDRRHADRERRGAARARASRASTCSRRTASSAAARSRSSTSAPIDGIVVTDTVPINPLEAPPNMTVLPVARPARRDDHERLRRRLRLGDLRRREPALLEARYRRSPDFRMTARRLGSPRRTGWGGCGCAWSFIACMRWR